MKIKIAKAQCLILDKRIQNLDKIQSEFYQKGIIVKSFIAGNGEESLKYDHIDTKDGPPRLPLSQKYDSSWLRYPSAYNAYLCHKKMIEQAQLEGKENLLIIEDDAHIEDDFDEIIEQAEPFLLSSKWDMIYFGSYHKNTSFPTENKFVRKVNGSAGFHCVLIHNRIFDEILEYGPICPMDEICNRFIHSKHLCYAIYPSIVTQTSGYSFVERSYLDKPSRWEL